MEDIDVVSGIDPRSLEYHWLRLRRAAREDAPGSETSAIARGRVSVTPLQFERTDQTVLASLQAATTASSTKDHKAKKTENSHAKPQRRKEKTNFEQE